jgi:tetratricopeptide (TPR) repeat protein
MHDLLNKFFERGLASVHRYEGTVNQFLGDGFMALFGAPVAHEDHALRAALAALAVARTFADRPLILDTGEPVPLSLRIGLNTGTVVVGAIGDNLRMDYTAVGDTTHLAARLQQMAAPGEIMVSEATARLVEGQVTLEARGRTAIRGLSAPVTVYRLTGERSRGGAAPPPRRRTRFVGRARELDTLGDMLERTRATGRGHAVGLTGEPGEGKSRLVLEFREQIGDGATWLEGRCLSHGRTIPYLPVQDVVRTQCGIADFDTPDEIASKVGAMLARVGVEPAERAPYVLSLLGVKTDTETVASVEGEVLRARTFDTLRQLVLRESRHRVVVLLLEDVHWIDPTSEAWLVSMADALAGAAVLLLATYRPGYRPGWLERSWASQLSLAPLTPDDSLQVVRDVLPGLESDDARARTILDRAEGNPFFLEELARVLGEDDSSRTAVVPDTIQGVLTARIDRLTSPLKRLLQTASVLGREFSTQLLAAVHGEAAENRSLEGDLGDLARLEFVHARVDADEPAWVFKHALTQEVAQATLLAGRRRELHRRAAMALEALYPGRVADLAPRLADHYAEAQEWPAVLIHARRAAERAWAAYANREALTRYDQALVAAERAVADPGDRQELLESRAAVHALLGGFAAARADLETALTLTRASGDDRARGRLLGALAALWGGHRDYPRALEFARQAVQLLAASGDRRALAEARSRLGIMLLNRGRLGESRAQLEDALTLFRDLGDETGQARTVDILAMCMVQAGDTARAVVYAEDAVRRLGATGDREAESSALVTLAFSRSFGDGWHSGEGIFNRARALAEAIGSPAAVSYARAAMAETALGFGRIGLAHREATEALRIARRIDHQEWIANALGALGRAHAASGDVTEARRLHEQMVATARELGTTIWLGKSLGDLGEDLMLADEFVAAADCLAEALDIAGEAVEPAEHALLVRIELALRRGRPDDALAASADARARLQGFAERALVLLEILEAETLAATGRAEDAERRLRDGQARAAALAARPAQWRAGLGLARILRDAGRLDEARRAAADAGAVLEATAAEIDDPELRRSFEGTDAFRAALAWRS